MTTFALDDGVVRIPDGLLSLAEEPGACAQFRFGDPVPGALGRRDVVLIDINARGASVRHVASVRPGDNVRLRFEYHGGSYDVESRVLTSSFIPHGTKDALYESRLRFTAISAESQESIEALIEPLSSPRERNGADRLAALPPVADPQASLPREPFTRCRYVGNQWQLEKTMVGDIPADGFVVPSWIGEKEIQAVCEAYERFDGEGRQLLRLFAAG